MCEKRLLQELHRNSRELDLQISEVLCSFFVLLHFLLFLVGIPTLIPSFLPQNSSVMLQSENGLLGCEKRMLSFFVFPCFL